MKSSLLMGMVAAASGLSLQFNSTGPATWADCGAGGHGHVSTVVFSPDPPAKGAALNTISGTGALDEDVSKALFDFVLTLGGVTLLSKKGSDICQDNIFNLPLGAGVVTVHKLNCPIAKGPVTLNIDAKIATIAPSGAVAVNIAATDQNAAPLLCVNVNFII